MNKMPDRQNTNHLTELVSISSSMFYGTTNYYKQAGFQWADVPAIVGITGACENVDTLFKVGNRLSLPLFFTQTGQLSLEQILQNSHGVYTIIHSGRDEGIEDERHLRQFRLTEEEFDCAMIGMTRGNYDEEKMYEALLIHIEKATKAMIRAVLDNNQKIIKSSYGRDPKKLSDILKRPYLRISYEEAVRMLRENGFDVSFGDDLEADHEAKIVELVNKKTKGYGSSLGEWSPVFIMKYPKEIKFFNMKVSANDPRVVLSADCIFPYSGEAVGSAVREEDGVKLIVRLLTSTMYKLHDQRGGTYEDFQWYTENMILAKKTLPHAGYGIGNERIIQFITGANDIRNCSLFSVMGQQTGDWDVQRRGMLPMVEHKKTVLLSIGRDENKEKLLPHIKKIKNDGHIFYTTDKTHSFLETHGIPTTRVYKISEGGKPNLGDLLKKDTFDLIINIPTGGVPADGEVTDGQFIRQTALETGTTLVTDQSVAESLLASIAKQQESKDAN